MAVTRFDITGIGNAIVDLLLQTDDGFLRRHDMPKGAMTLIDADTATRLTAEMAGRADGVRRVGGQYLRGGGGVGRARGVSGQGGG